EFTARLTVPRDPGEYTVELGLVNAQVTRLSEYGIEPLKVGIRVLSPPSVDFDRLVTEQLKSIDDPPQVAISTDRPRYKPGEFLHLVLDFTNPGMYRRIDGYLALSWPQGWLSFHAASQRFWAPERAWMPFIRRAFLPMGVQHAGFPIFTRK